MPIAERNVIIGSSAVCYGPMARHLGLLAGALARREDAEAHFKAAMDRCREIQFPPGKRAQAAGLLHEALDAANRVGMVKATRGAELLIASLDN